MEGVGGVEGGTRDYFDKEESSKVSTSKNNCQNLKSLATLTCTSPASNPCSGKRQLAVSGNALDHLAVRADPQW